MARTVRDAKLESRAGRGGLKPAGKPYYKALDEGLHLGYRKGKAAGKWVLRLYVNGAYETETIGIADDTLDADEHLDISTILETRDVVLSFKQAQAKARRLYEKQRRAAAGLPAESGPYKVKHAIEDYLGWMEKEGRKSVRDSRIRANAVILPKLGEIECSKLTAKHLREWRDDLATEARRLRTKAGEAQRYREIDEDDEEGARRRKASANRVLTILKAALNHAWRERRIASDDTWRRVQPFREADAARPRYLTPDECRRLLNAAEGDFRTLVRAALLTGARYGELAALTVRDFNADAGTLHIRKSKSGKDRHVILTDEGTAFFRSIAAGRPATERLLLKDDGTRWGAAHQSRPMRAACEIARIEPPVSFHALRHTWASLSVMGGMPLMVVAKNLGHADTRMVEKHYGHLAEDWLKQAVRSAAPQFGIEPDQKVVAL